MYDFVRYGRFSTLPVLSVYVRTIHGEEGLER